MKKGLKITLIVLGVLVNIVALDTLQAIIFDNSPFLKIRDNLDGGTIDYIDKGIFVNHYHCNSNEKVTTWKGTKFACSIKENLNDKITIKSIDDFYNTSLTKNNDIRNLDSKYNFDKAIKDNCFVEASGKLYNEDLYTKFKNNYNNKKDSFIRVGRATIEGDLMLYDILYYNDKIYLVTDYSRDNFGNESKLKLEEYNYSLEYENEWILTNETDIKTDNYFTIVSLKENNTFIQTFNVLNVANSNDEKYYYLTLRAFQDEEVVTVKILRELYPKIKENNNYEFTFLYDNKKIKENDIKELFDNRKLIKITETSKVGLDQIMDNVNK